MKILKHRTIDAISRLPETASIEDVENVLKRIARESKNNISEASYIKGTEKTLAGAFDQLGVFQ